MTVGASLVVSASPAITTVSSGRTGDEAQMIVGCAGAAALTVGVMARGIKVRAVSGRIEPSPIMARSVAASVACKRWCKAGDGAFSAAQRCLLMVNVFRRIVRRERPGGGLKVVRSEAQISHEGGMPGRASLLAKWPFLL